jgi:hypothetical protein
MPDESISLSSPGYIATTPDPRGIIITIPDVSSLDDFPESGEICFRFKRHDLRLNRANKLSATIELTELCDVKEADEKEESPKEDAVDKLFAEASKQATT